jgi:hypothetical protein
LSSRRQATLGEVPQALLDQTWVIATTDQDLLRRYIQTPGWEALVQRRDFAEAAKKFGPSGGMGTARAHAEQSAQYRQAAVLAAHSFTAAYDDGKEPHDPHGTAHLLTVAYATLGQRRKAARFSEKYGQKRADPAASWHAPWASWLAAGGEWPPDLSSLPLELPPIQPGLHPEVGPFPHYALPHKGASGAVDMADPAALLALAAWHHEAAVAAAGGDREVIDLFVAPWRTPADPHVSSERKLPMEFLFGSSFLTPLDAAFLADLTGSGGTTAADRWADRSIVAHVAVDAGKSGHLDAVAAQDCVEAVRAQIIKRAAQKSGGQVLGPHKLFANIARSGLYWNLALVADAHNDIETAGRLRIMARDAAVRVAESHPTSMLTYAAWDARNRFTMRALDTIHNQARWDPALETAQYAVEVLDLRLQHQHGDDGPM